MSFIDGLNEVATINTITTAEDSYGKEVKVSAPLYENIQCRLGKGTPRLVKDDGKEEKFIITYKLYTLAEYSAAKSGDQIIVNGKTYIIIWGNPAIGGEINHYIYNIKIDE